MSTHLSEEQIENYLERRLSRAELPRVNGHLFGCEACYGRFLELFEERRLPLEIDLDELGGLKGWHLEGEDLKAYVEGRMDQLDLDFANLHLRECAWCREEVDSYSEFSKKLPYYLSKRHVPLKQPAAHGATRWSRVQTVAAAAMILLVLGSMAVFWSFLQTKPRGQNAHAIESPQTKNSLPDHSSPDPSMADRPDASPRPDGASHPKPETKGSTPSRSISPFPGNRRAVSGEQQESEAVLIARELVMPLVIETFDRSPAALRSDSKHLESFNVISPYSTLISEDRPTFRWTALGGAASYTVSVFDADLNLVKTSGPLTETEWAMPIRLRRGTLYTWIVTAIKDGKEVVAPAAPRRAEFQIIQQSELVKLNRRIKVLSSGAARAVLYAEAGLLDQAEQEFRDHLTLHPADEHAKQLLQTVRSWRAP